MKNAHLRLGQLEYVRSTEKIQTRVKLHVDRYMGEEGQGHLLSVFGGDADVGAVAAAIHEKHPFTLTFPDGKVKIISMGADASCYRGALTIPGRKQPLRHLVAVSEALHANGSAGRMFLLNYDRGLAWVTLVSFLGLPADPRWGDWLIDRLERDEKVAEIEGIGCGPVAILATRDSLLEVISKGLEQGELCFPEVNGPVLWPSFKVQDALRIPAALF
ncbi:MAG: hypothetical protein WCE63_11725 [Acidobacteriaceae bacterium]